MPLFQCRLPFSGQRRLLRSGTGMKRHRNFLIVEGTRRGSLSRRHKEGWSLDWRGGGVRWSSPKKIFKFKMSVEAILMNFEDIFSCETSLFYKHAIFSRVNKLILQA